MVRHTTRLVVRAFAAAIAAVAGVVALGLIPAASVSASSRGSASPSHGSASSRGSGSPSHGSASPDHLTTAQKRAAAASVARAVAAANANKSIGAPAGAVAARTAANVEVVQTSPNLSQHLTRLRDVKFSSKRPKRLPMINVDDAIRYQHVRGVGAAMTDTSAWLIQQQLTPGARDQLMQHLFGLNGIDLNFTLVPIGATDFTMNGTPYTYDDQPPGQSDPQLANFSIAHDLPYVLPALRLMLAINPQTEVFAVPWSPPAWMKANQALDNIGHGGTLLPSAYGPFANYFVKFIQGYASQGVPIAAVAPENEPASPAAFPGMELPEATEAQFISQYLQPALRAAHLPTRIYGGDTAWKNPGYPQALLSGPARGSLNGIAWHCYNGIPYVIAAAHDSAPSVDHIVTECSPGISPYPVPEVMIGSMRNWAREVTLWNLALDPSGGPVQPPNSGCKGCTGLVTIDEQTHQLSYNASYYQLGQLGRFVQPGAARVDSNHFVNYYHTSTGANGATLGLDDVAFVNPDGSRVVVAYNNSRAPIKFGVSWRHNYFTYTLPAGATVTFAWDRSSASGQATVAVNPQTGGRYVFWQGPDGFIQEAWSSGVSWSGPVKMVSWGRTASSPSVAIGNDNHQFVFWQGGRGHIFEAWYQDGSWHGPRDMTNAMDWATTSGAPAVAINPENNHQFVFWRGADGSIRQAWWNGRWHGPVNLRWKASSAPSVAVSNDSHQYVFWAGNKGHVEEAWYGHHWNGPVDMTRSEGWPTAKGAPAVAVNPSTDHQYVFWRDSRDHIQQALASETGWHTPRDMTVHAEWGQTLSAPSAAVTNNYRQYVFWRATAGNIREALYQSSWQTVDLNWR
jgi:glucosylceramidase